MEEKINQVREKLMEISASCKLEENILIVTDTGHFEVGMAVWKAVEQFPNRSMILINGESSGKPTATVMAATLAADVIFCCTDCPLPDSVARTVDCISALD